MKAVDERCGRFCTMTGLDVPILMTPMAGACPVALSAAVARAGGMGACGALLMQPHEIANWADAMRRETDGAFQINTWIPDPPAARDPGHEGEIRRFLADWGPEIPADPPAVPLPDFDAQCAAMIEARPAAMSSIMGLFPSDVVARLKEAGILWFATVTTVTEAREAATAGADVIVAQGAEAGGHRGAFVAQQADQQMVGLFSLLPAIVDAVRVPVVATGGIADARGVAAALMLGASAVQIGTGLLRTPEAAQHPLWADALARTDPENTTVTRAFSGRSARAIRTAYVQAASAADAPVPAPYPVQRALTAPMRQQAVQNGIIDSMQLWAGQSAALARAEPAETLVIRLWSETRALLG